MNIILFIMFSFSSVGVAAESLSPYYGQEQRSIKSLSDSEITGYLSGGGMGFAKAAELNKYPGPKHVLEISNKIGLSNEQAQKTQLLYESMNLKAKKLGFQLVEKEKELNEAFVLATITSDQLMGFTEEIANLKGQIRYVHLEAHLSQKKLLSKRQIHKYSELRGYAHEHSGQH